MRKLEEENLEDEETRGRWHINTSIAKDKAEDNDKDKAKDQK